MARRGWAPSGRIACARHVEGTGLVDPARSVAGPLPGGAWHEGRPL